MLITPEYVFQDVTHITPEWLAEKGIRALVLDIDNTLTADRSQELPDEVAQWLEDNKLRAQAWFTVDDLKYLRRGGRIGAMAATVGTMLDLKPIITENREGKLVSSDKVRGRKAALRLIADKAAENIDDPAQAMTIILHADAPEDAARLETMLRERVPELGEIQTYYVGPVIGAHCGPGTVAICFFGKERPC